MRNVLLATVAASFVTAPLLADPQVSVPSHRASLLQLAQFQDPRDQGERDRQAGEQYQRDHFGDQGDRRDGDRRDGNGQRQDGDRRDGNDYRRDGEYAGGSYYPEKDYRAGRKYRTRYLGQNEQVYRGRDDRYYCKRSDGTTGLIIGGLGGGVLGNIIAPGGSKTLGTVLGGGLGAVLGDVIGSNRKRVQCR